MCLANPKVEKNDVSLNEIYFRILSFKCEPKFGE